MVELTFPWKMAVSIGTEAATAETQKSEHRTYARKQRRVTVRREKREDSSRSKENKGMRG